MTIGKFIRQLTRQLTAAASQVNDSEIWAHFHKCQQVIKWSRTLSLKFVIKVWVPGHARDHGPWMMIHGQTKKPSLFRKGYEIYLRLAVFLTAFFTVFLGAAFPFGDDVFFAAGLIKVWICSCM